MMRAHTDGYWCHLSSHQVYTLNFSMFCVLQYSKIIKTLKKVLSKELTNGVEILVVQVVFKLLIKTVKF